MENQVNELKEKLLSKLPNSSAAVSVAKDFAREMSTKLIAKTIAAAAKLRAADKEQLKTAAKSGAIVAGGFLIASKLLGLQVILGVMAGTIALSEILDKASDESDKQKIKAAFDELKAQKSAETTE